MNNEFFASIINTAIKSIIAITVLFLTTRVIGKKHIAHLTFFDYVVGIAVGSIAGTLSVDRRITLAEGITALVVWGAVAFLVAVISIKSLKARHFFDSRPVIFIENGIINRENLRKEKININDLLEELRIKGVFNPADVEFAVMETGGEVSVLLKSQKRPVTPSDIHVPTHYQGLSTNLIIDGSIIHENLEYVGWDEKWLKEELSKKNITSADDVLLASLDTEGGLYISLKAGKI